MIKCEKKKKNFTPFNTFSNGYCESFGSTKIDLEHIFNLPFCRLKQRFIHYIHIPALVGVKVKDSRYKQLLVL